MDSQRNARYYALKSVVGSLSVEVRRMDYYLSLLPIEESTVIRCFYFEGMNLMEITQNSTVSQSTVQRRKKQGLDRLTGYYSVLDNLSDTLTDGSHSGIRFISYMHEERYAQCLERMKDTIRMSGTEAIVYIISGCDELWNAGVDAFLDFETWEVKAPEALIESLSEQAAKLLRLACCYALGFNPRHLSQLISRFFSGLEYVHLELAIESLRVAQIITPNS